MGFLALIGAVQFLYCVLAGNYVCYGFYSIPSSLYIGVSLSRMRRMQENEHMLTQYITIAL